MKMEPIVHHHVRVRRRHPAIYQHQNQLQLFSTLKITFDHRAPILFHSLGDFCVSITWKIYEIHPFIDQKEIDRLRPAGR